MALQGQWKLSGGVWTDTSGNGYTLTKTGTVNQATGFLGGANTAASIAGGSGSFLRIANPANLHGVSAFGIGFRYKPASYTTIQVLCIKETTGTTGLEYALIVGVDGKISFRRSTNGTSFTTILTGSAALTIGNWVCGFLWWDGANMAIYVDNMSTADTTVASTGNTNSSTGSFTILGNSDGGLNLNGTVDDFEFFDHAPTEAERIAYKALGENFAPVTTQVSLNETLDSFVDGDSVVVANTVTLNETLDSFSESISIIQQLPTTLSFNETLDSFSESILVFPEAGHVSLNETLDSFVDYGLVQITGITEKINYTGAIGDVSATVTFQVMRQDDNYLLDYGNLPNFKASTDVGMVNPNIPMTLILSSPRPVYQYNLNTTLFNGDYYYIPYSANAIDKPESYEASYSFGVRKIGGLTFSDTYLLQSAIVALTKIAAATTNTLTLPQFLALK